MDIERFAGSTIGRFVTAALAASMESRLRYRFFGPQRILSGADIHPGQTVLEIGCGTGFFTLPAAQYLRNQGRLISIDVVAASVQLVLHKVEDAGLHNVRVVRCDAMNTGLEKESIDAILLFGVIPAPMLPLPHLLPEMHRILKPGGTMAVWPPTWVRQSIVHSGMFSYAGRRNAVLSFRRI